MISLQRIRRRNVGKIYLNLITFKKWNKTSMSAGYMKYSVNPERIDFFQLKLKIILFK